MAELFYTRCPVPTATGIAAGLGWLPADARSLQDGAVSTALRAEHFTHELTSLIREGGNVPALWARSRGADTRLIGLTWIDERQAIVVRPEDGAGGDRISLAGLRVAVPRRPAERIDFWRAMALAGFAGALALEGETLGAVALVDVESAPDGRGPDGFAPEVDAVAAGRADAAYVKGAPGLEAAARAGLVVGIDLDDVPDRTTRVNNGTPRPITVHARLLEERPDDVVAFVATLLRAADWAAEHPDEVAGALARETYADATYVAGAYRDDFHRSLHLDLGDERLALLGRQKDFLYANGFLEADVDVAAWADHTILDAARERRTKELI
ncbi:MAG TPA: ABC transporter substrate-binding protein [Baekduia sp.]|uniref:ABC transporter substrate-binding protein n=1 Tax=Baekduia sp. TaxID=2600305 RepID=UPI002D7921CD|nr:ABC transporter substrate-binding protein [Baekduia sp.]HET6510152.1 ABC transporter substrate-binding protein [Baekduia sp.]